jgi:hypothetical protein
MTSEERLERLEKELALTKRRIRRLLQGVVCLFVAGCVFAVLLSTMGSAKAQGEKVIRANKFILEDQNGKSRAFLSMNNGGPRLMMTDQNGKVRVALAILQDIMPSLGLRDENEKSRIQLYEIGEVSFLDLKDQNEKKRASLSVVDGMPGLSLFGQNGKERASLSVFNEGPRLVFKDQNEKVRAGLRVDNEEGPVLSLLDQNEMTRASLGMSRIITPDGKTISYPESSIILFGPKQKVLWQAP